MKYTRLKKRSDFGRVFKQGHTFGDRYLVLFVLEHQAEIKRVGFAAQRSAGSAVKRNRIRRRLRALYTRYADEVQLPGDLVVLGKRTVLDAEWTVLVQSMERVMRRAGFLKGRGKSARKG